MMIRRTDRSASPCASTRKADRPGRSRRFRAAAEMLEVRSLLSTFGLDTTFNGTGTALVPNTGGTTVATAVQADGSVLLAGTIQQGVNSSLIVERLTPAGVPDATFGVGGRATVAFGALGFSSDFPISIAVGPDGKVIVAGSEQQSTGDPEFALARLNTDGTVDATFGTAGTVTLAFAGNRYESAFFVSVASTGKVLVVGSGVGPVSTTDNGTAYLDIARLNMDGSLDATYGTGGEVIRATVNPNNGYNFYKAAAIGPDGKLFVAGFVGPYQNAVRTISTFTLRLNADGSADTAFGPDGEAQTPFGPLFAGNLGLTGQDGAVAIAVAPDGSFYLAGPDFTVAHFGPDGTAAPNLGGVRNQYLQEFTSESAASMGLLPDGRVVVVGLFQRNDPGASYSSFAVAYYDASGTPDVTHGDPGTPGLTSFNFGLPNESAKATSVAVMPDGRVVVAGQAASEDGPAVDFAAARFSAFPAATLSADEKYVLALYEKFLGRLGNLAELDFQVGQLATLGRGGVAKAIAGSPEGLARTVNLLYQTDLGRPADPTGLAAAVAQLQAGMTTQQVSAELLASPEFYGNGPYVGQDQNFVQNLYQLVLGRTGSTAEVSYWVGLLPKLGRRGEAQAFLGSAEHRAHSVQADYVAILNRQASAADSNFYVDGPLPLDAIPLVLASSAEFYPRA